MSKTYLGAKALGLWLNFIFTRSWLVRSMLPETVISGFVTLESFFKLSISFLSTSILPVIVAVRSVWKYVVAYFSSTVDTWVVTRDEVSQDPTSFADHS